MFDRITEVVAGDVKQLDIEKQYLELGELQLALVGGGIGTVTVA